MPAHAPAYAIITHCPACGGHLRLRERRDGTGAFFGCSHYPQCRVTLPYDEVLSALAARVHAAEGRLPLAGVDPSVLDRELRRLLGLVHPDKWQGSAVAEELTKAVVAFRERLQHGRL